MKFRTAVLAALALAACTHAAPPPRNAHDVASPAAPAPAAHDTAPAPAAHESAPAPTTPDAAAAGEHPAPATERDAAAPAGHPEQHRFANAEEWAKKFDDPARDAWQQPDKVIAALGLAPTMTVADVGAGTGYFSVRLSRALPEGHVIATDLEPDMVRYLGERAAREHLPNIRAVLAGSDDPHLDAGSVDRELVVDVWHHVGDRVRYARGLAAALRPGGKLAIVEFIVDAPHGPKHHPHVTPDQVLSDLRAAGLDASLSSTKLSDQFIAIGTKSAAAK